MASRESPPSSPPRSADERLMPRERLRRRADFLRCYRAGRRRQGALALVYYVRNLAGHPRIGITASRKVGAAVVRNRLKRRIREIYRRWPERAALDACDLVVHLKPEAAGAGFAVFREDVLRLLGGVAATHRRQGH